MHDAPVSRREALKAVAAAAALATFALPSAADAAPAAGVLTPADRALAESIADTILPTTASSPGARAAGAGAAMNLLLTDCYDGAAQRRVVAGLVRFRADHPAFASRPRAERERILVALDREARAAEGHWFSLAREVAERAYWSSEVGMTRALRWVMVPGRWVGCVPLKPGQPAWG